MSNSSDKENRRKRKRIRLHEVSLEQDIRYRGPLSYRHFRIIGWICIALSQVVILLGLAASFSADLAEKTSMLKEIISSIASLSLPLLVFASFAVILGSGNGYKKQLLTMGGAAVAIIALFELFFYRYIIGVTGHLIGDRKAATEMINGFFSESTSSHFLAFNLFVDVAICILFVFFLDYRPVRFFQGKKLVIFRLFALIPVFYEAGSILLKILSGFGTLRIPPVLFPFLTTKPPIMFMVFVVMTFYIKNRERRFCKYGRAHEEYKAFLKTNRNSWNFSVFTCKILVIAGIIDFVVLIVFLLLEAIRTGMIEQIRDSAGPLEANVYTPLIQQAVNIGIGKSMILVLFAPVMLLFSYTKTYKNKLIDLLIPIGGVVLIIFVYLEGIFFGSAFIRLPA